jgi:hypothetical protein
MGPSEAVRRKIWIPFHIEEKLSTAGQAFAPSLSGIGPLVSGTGPHFREKQISPGQKGGRMRFVGAVSHGDIPHYEPADGDHSGHFSLTDHSFILEGGTGKINASHNPAVNGTMPPG